MENMNEQHYEYEKRWFDGPFLQWGRPPSVRPIKEMSFRNILAVPSKGWV